MAGSAGRLLHSLAVELLHWKFRSEPSTAGVDDSDGQTASMDPALYRAAISGDVNFLAAQQNPAALLTQVTPKGNTILHITAELGHLESFKAAARLCPSLLNKPNSNWDTSLHVASRMGRAEVVDFIINYLKSLAKDDIESGSRQGNKKKYRDKKLLCQKNRQKENALHLAARYGHYQVAKSLIEADPELSTHLNNEGEPAWFVAIANMNAAVADLIMSCTDDESSLSLESLGGGKGTALHAALYAFSTDTKLRERNNSEDSFTPETEGDNSISRISCYDILNIIMKKKPEIIQEGDRIGWTPIHYAAYSGTVKAVQLFLNYENGSAAYLLGRNGESALHIAAYMGHLDVIKSLALARPDCWDLVDHKGRTALHAAVLGGQEDVVRWILQSALAPEGLANEADKCGNTPLHLAVLHKRLKIIHILASSKRVSSIPANKGYLASNCSIINEKPEEVTIQSGEDQVMSTEWKNNYGFQNEQQRAIKQVKEIWSRESGVEVIRASMAAAVGTIQNDQKSDDDSDRLSDSDENLLQVSATLIATVTFAAAFTLPGGYVQSGSANEGMAILAKKAAFQAFVVFDILAFFFSTGVVYKQVISRIGKRQKLRVPFMEYFLNINAALMTFEIAFTCGLYVVLDLSAKFGVGVLVSSVILALYNIAGSATEDDD